MKVAFHGAAQTVTGSRHLIECNGRQLLLDCGLYQGHRRQARQINLEFPFDPAGLDAVILSHAHIDHSGNLPNLVQQGFRGPIYAIDATVHLTDLMTRDSGHIQEADADYLNRKREGEPPVEPLYTAADAAYAARQLEEVDYGQQFEPIPGVLATLHDAGHILGSATVQLDMQEGGRSARLVFSGDIGRPGMALLRDPVQPERADFLIMECTYGNRLHNPPQQAYDELLQCLDRTFGRGGRVIIPAFAVGRTQALVYYLHQMIERSEIQEVPVYVDSPLAINVSAVFREHPHCFSAETRQFIASDPHGAALGFDRLKYTLSVEESKAINRIDGPAVIISASGMAEVGRILHHLKNNIEDPRNTVLITSWMAPHTLGRRLVEGEPRVRIFGKHYDVNAEVSRINGLSAHADQAYLLEWSLATEDTLRQVFLVHGEAEPAAALTELLQDRGVERVSYPAMGDEFDLT